MVPAGPAAFPRYFDAKRQGGSSDVSRSSTPPVPPTTAVVRQVSPQQTREQLYKDAMCTAAQQVSTGKAFPVWLVTGLTWMHFGTAAHTVWVSFWAGCASFVTCIDECFSELHADAPIKQSLFGLWLVGYGAIMTFFNLTPVLHEVVCLQICTCFGPRSSSLVCL